MENFRDHPLTCYVLDGHGGSRCLPSPELNQHQSAWIHMDYSDPNAQLWLFQKSQLENLICEALIAEETRPRVFFTSQGILMTLRAINTIPGEDPEDMVSVRIWIEENRIITSSKRIVPAIQEMKIALQKHNGPHTIMDLLITLIDNILNHVSEIIDTIDDNVEQLETEIIQKAQTEGYQLRIRLSTLKRRIITLRRYLAPQREALGRAHMIDLPWLTQTYKLHLLELADRTIRYIEDLDEARDYSTVIHETIASIISEQVERRMYILSTVASIFLPLSLIAGLLGMNVGGIPGGQTPEGFLLVVSLVVVIGFIEYFIFKKKRWM